MIELPEAVVLKNQLQVIVGKKITNVVFNQSPHKLVWFFQAGVHYENILLNKTITEVASYGGQVLIKFTDGKIVLGDGINIRYQPKTPPLKHQLVLELDHQEKLFFFAQMYGGIMCYTNEDPEYYYLKIAKEKPDPLSDQFSKSYWNDLFTIEENPSLKAFLATNQRIPGIGNGVIQDILWRAKLHPKQKIHTLTIEDKNNLFDSIKNTLQEMINQNGRSSEKGIDGRNGEFNQFSQQDTCLVCASKIIKEAYLGGSIYYCPTCQKLEERRKT